MSSYLGGVGVRCPLIVEYCQGISSPGSPLLHSFCFKAEPSSRAARLGIISEVGSSGGKRLACSLLVLTIGTGFYIWTHTFLNKVHRIF